MPFRSMSEGDNKRRRVEGKLEEASQELKEAQAKLEQAQAKLEQAQAKLEQAQAKLEQAQAKLEQAVKDRNSELAKVLGKQVEAATLAVEEETLAVEAATFAVADSRRMRDHWLTLPHATVGEALCSVVIQHVRFPADACWCGHVRLFFFLSLLLKLVIARLLITAVVMFHFETFLFGEQ